VPTAARFSSDRLYHCAIALFILFVTSAAAFNGFYDKWHFRESSTGQFDYQASFEKMVDGTADRPYVYRQLLPTLANWIDASTPASIKARILTPQGYRLNFVLNQVIRSPLAQNPVYGLRYRILYILCFGFTFLASVSLYLAARTAGNSHYVALLVTVAFMLFMPWVLSVGGYYYDFPELAFFALSFWMAHRFQWWWLIPVVILATWNKESFLLTIPVLYPLIRQRLTKWKALLATGVLGLSSLGIYFYVHNRFRLNPGGTVEVHFAEQFEFRHHLLRSLFDVDITYGLLTFSVSSLFFLGFVAWTTYRGWPLLKKAHRYYLLLAFAINVPLFYLFGKPGELRGFSIVYVGFVLLMAANLSQWIRQNPESQIAGS
jgi:hypothetical protein